MAAMTIERQARQARSRYLRTVAAEGGGARGATVLLLGDTLAAIAFAAGLSRAIVAVRDGTMAMLPWLTLALLAGVARGIFTMAASRLGAAGAQSAKLGLRRRIMAALFRQRADAILTAGTIMNAAVDEVEAVDGYVSRFLPARIAAAIAPLLVLAAAALASPIAAGILAATLLPFILAMALAGGAAADESRRQFVALSQLSGLFADRIPRAAHHPGLSRGGTLRHCPRARRRRAGAAHDGGVADRVPVVGGARILRRALGWRWSRSMPGSTCLDCCLFRCRNSSICRAPSSCWRWPLNSTRRCGGWRPPTTISRRPRPPPSGCPRSRSRGIAENRKPTRRRRERRLRSAFRRMSQSAMRTMPNRRSPISRWRLRRVASSPWSVPIRQRQEQPAPPLAGDSSAEQTAK